MFTLLRVLVATGALLSLSAAHAQSLLWFHNNRLTSQARAVLGELREAHRYGLLPEDYTHVLPQIEVQRALAGTGTAAQNLQFDNVLSATVMTFVTHLRQGRVGPTAAGFHLPAASQPFDAASTVRTIAVSRNVRESLSSLEPRAKPYRLLKQALATYQLLARDPGLTSLPPLPHSLANGEDYDGAVELRRLLAALGDLPQEETVSRERTLNDALVDALRRFQRRHGLNPDGVLGKQTYAELTTPLHVRVHQIELTLERWRWTYALDRPDIVVNVPQYMLFALPRSPEESLLEMSVIVGQQYPHTRTPLFTALLKTVVFQPFWDVPPSIVRRELLPLIRKDIRYLERHHMEIVRGQGDDGEVVPPTEAAIGALSQGRLRLRQRPGPDNALGQVKFVLPNPYHVYLHATPSVRLFDRAQRAFSHGCIRVSEPQALAQYVLKNADPAWDAAAIEAAMCGTKTQRVELQQPLRVLIFYGTAAVTESLGVLFYDDVYGYDAKLDALLAARSRS